MKKKNTKKSKRQIGNQFQDWIENWIKKYRPEAAVHNQKTVSKMIKVRDEKSGELKEVWISKRNDIFGCIDLICILPTHKPVYIQATVDTSVTKRQLELERVKWNFNHANVELWLKRKVGEVQIKKLTEDGLKDYAKIIRGKLYRLES